MLDFRYCLFVFTWLESFTSGASRSVQSLTLMSPWHFRCVLISASTSCSSTWMLIHRPLAKQTRRNVSTKQPRQFQWLVQVWSTVVWARSVQSYPWHRARATCLRFSLDVGFASSSSVWQTAFAWCQWFSPTSAPWLIFTKLRKKSQKLGSKFKQKEIQQKKKKSERMVP